MEQKKNTNYLLKLYIPGLIFDGIILAILIYYSILDNQLRSFLQFMVGFILFFGLIFGFVFYVTNIRYHRKLQSESPEPLIAYFEAQQYPRFLAPIFSRFIFPYHKLTIAYTRALAYTYYGQFAAAREELEKVDWGKSPPMFQASRKYVETLHVYLEKKDFQGGLERAQETYKLRQVASFIPFSKMASNFYKTLVEIGLILNGNLDTTIITSLEKKFKWYPVLSKVLIAWALEKAYNQMGKTEQANQMRAYLNQTAPHCIAFAR